MPRHQGVWFQQSTLSCLAPAGLASSGMRVPMFSLSCASLQIEFLSRLDFVATGAFFMRGVAKGRDMALAMKCPCREFKILGCIIQAITVFVVNMLVRAKAAADQFFNDGAVFQNRLTVLADLQVSTICNLASPIFGFENGDWIAVPPPTKVMLLTPAATFNRFETVWNGAFRLLHKRLWYQQEVCFA